uniref:PWWP domain-containing protein n=1 Tax=Macrostomum lignano TaxID=282301 RepID=A0A1I8JRB6_9PLAT
MYIWIDSTGARTWRAKTRTVETVPKRSQGLSRPEQRLNRGCIDPVTAHLAEAAENSESLAAEAPLNELPAQSGTSDGLQHGQAEGQNSDVMHAASPWRLFNDPFPAAHNWKLVLCETCGHDGRAAALSNKAATASSAKEFKALVRHRAGVHHAGHRRHRSFAGPRTAFPWPQGPYYTWGRARNVYGRDVWWSLTTGVGPCEGIVDMGDPLLASLRLPAAPGPPRTSASRLRSTRSRLPGTGYGAGRTTNFSTLQMRQPEAMKAIIEGNRELATARRPPSALQTAQSATTRGRLSGAARDLQHRRLQLRRGAPRLLSSASRAWQLMTAALTLEDRGRLQRDPYCVTEMLSYRPSACFCSVPGLRELPEPRGVARGWVAGSHRQAGGACELLFCITPPECIPTSLLEPSESPSPEPQPQNNGALRPPHVPRPAPVKASGGSEVGGSLSLNCCHGDRADGAGPGSARTLGQLVDCQPLCVTSSLPLPRQAWTKKIFGLPARSGQTEAWRRMSQTQTHLELGCELQNRTQHSMAMDNAVPSLWVLAAVGHQEADKTAVLGELLGLLCLIEEVIDLCS